MSNDDLQGFSLSPQQERLWLLMQAGGESGYRTDAVVLLEGPLDRSALSGALDDLRGRHEILRTTFHFLGGMSIPLQVVGESGGAVLAEEAAGETPQDLAGLVAEAGRQGFDLAAGPLLRTALVSLAADRHALLLSLPALCADAAALGVLVRDLAACYAHRRGSPAPAGEPLQYADLAAWQRDLLEPADGEGRGDRRGVPSFAGLRLPGERQGGEEPFAPRVEPIEIGPAAERLTAVAERWNLPPHLLVLACWQALLARRASAPDLTLGVAFDGRRYEGLDQAVGLFARYLPIQAKLSGQPLEELARALSADLGEAREEQELFFWASGSDFFPCLFDHEELAGPVTAGGLLFRLAEQRSCTERYRLRLSCRESAGALSLTLHYDSGSVSQVDVARLATAFRSLLDGALADPRRRIDELPIMGEVEHHQLLFESNDTAAGRGEEVCVHQRVEELAAHSPQAPAVVYGDQTLTYGELNRRANQLARHLVSLRVGPEVTVAVCVERSLEMVVAILGVLKAGGAYVPLDPSYPSDRLAFMLADSGAPILLTKQRLRGTIPQDSARAICLDSDWTSIASAATGDLALRARLDAVAYIIYTSGSTGKPKGVMISHRGLANYLGSCAEIYAIGEHAGAPVHSSFGFDLTVTSLLAPLHAGRAAFLVPEADGIGGLGDLLARQGGFSLIKITPAHLEVLAPLLAPSDLAGRVATVIVGGEALRYEALEMWRIRAPETRIINEYGPTEAVVGCCTYEVRTGDPAAGAVPIGRPLPNARLYLLDAGLAPVPLGAEGELYIGGGVLARGYLRRQDLTGDRFLPDPFAPEPGGRMYRTGDLARWRSDGQLEFLARVDHQVKIRGYRIELGEIESVLCAHPAVEEAVVLAREDHPGERRLVAYLLPAGEADLVPEELRDALARKLPDHMIPTAFEIVSGWPLTPNGKVDRRALPPPRERSSRRAAAWAAPRNLVEEVLATIWAEALGVPRVGIDDNFFQLGGDSILTITVLSKAREKGFSLSPQDFFRFPTVGGLARELLTASAKTPLQEPAAPFALLSDEDRKRLPEGLEDAYPLTRLQAGMLFHSEHGRGTAVYHDITSFHLRGALDVPALRAAIEQLVQRHPVLRTSFSTTGFSEPLQLVHRLARPAFRAEDLRHLSPAEQDAELGGWREREKLLPFDWGRPSLVRFQVHVRAADAFQFTLSYHHAIVDGWSVASILVELFQHYASLLRNESHHFDPLPEITYRDFVALEQQAVSSPEQQRFWSDRLAGHTFLALPRLEEPAALAQVAIRPHDVPLPPSLVDALRRLASEEGLPLKTLALAAHVKVLGVLGGQADVLTGMVSHGRPEVVGSERIVGLFINSLPLRVGLGKGSWREVVRRVFKAERDLLPYRRYPLAEIQRHQGGKPLFETLFNFVHFHVYDGISELHDVELVDAVFFEETNFTFTANFKVAGSGLQLRLDYDASEFPPHQMEAIAGYYRATLAAMADDPEARHEELSPLAEPERLQIEAWSGSVGDVSDIPHRLLHECFQDSAQRTPDAPAVLFTGGALTYRELDRAANVWARRLRALGVGTDRVVGVFAERSPEAVIAQLAIFKAGGTYLPLDPAYPRARLAFMAETSGISVLLTQEHLIKDAPSEIANVLVVSAADTVAAGAEGEDGDPGSSVPPEALAYVIYTSGSTGLPKRVGVTHRGLANLIVQQVRWFGVEPGSRVLQFASPSFDAAISEVGMTYSAGATLCLPASRAETLPGPDLLCLLRDRAITHATLPPSALAALPPTELPDLRTLIAAGEALPAEIAGRWAPGRRLFNAYGPSEGTVCATIGEVAASGRPSIGRPLDNAKVHVLDRDLLPAPVGTAGELYIGGPQLARGYLGRPDLTAARFIPSPYGEAPGARIYATGDTARFRPDGEIDFLGRIDQQVKIRGFRVELGEIEAVLVQHSALREGAVVVREDEPGDRRLVAYVVPHMPGGMPSVEELRDFLRERLPEHMLPAAFVSLESLPLTPNGKLDRRSLPAPEARRANLRTGWLAPRTEAERVIAGIWRDVLRVDRVGLEDNFFDLGGHSLHLLQIQGRIREALAVDVTMLDLLTHTNVSALASHLTRSSVPADRSLETAAPASTAADGRAGIAIIAAAGRFPGAADVEELWSNLMAGVESITFFTPEELRADGVAAADLADPAYVRARGVLQGAEDFDAGFFGVTPREAELTDPQQRVFLECAWEALERSGYLADRQTGAVGVFAGESMNTYLFNLLSNPELVESIGAFQAVTINDKDFLATRVSYKLDLEGPSLSVQTACSTSLVAVHLACQSLLGGECEIALAGGVSVRVPQRSGYHYRAGAVDSPDGHCRAFDAAAQGTVAGNGVGVVVLKKLDKAVADGDEILAVIKGSAINNDGSRKAGFTAPRVAGQAQVIRAAHLAAGVDAGSIGYVEGHGTGTPMGDPIEVAALTEAFRATTDRTGFCALGSIKANIGHLDAASGVTGLIKAALALQHEAIPPHLHFERPNPQIDFLNSPFRVNSQPIAWPRGDAPRRAGVSSFGIGGTNVHLVLEEAPRREPPSPSHDSQVLILSARSPAALDHATERLARHLAVHPELDLEDVAYTLQAGRRSFDHRRMVVGGDTRAAAAALSSLDGRLVISSVEEARRRPVAFLFSGQGAQYVGMAADVYGSRPVFRDGVDRCAEILAPSLGFDLREVLYPRDEERDEAALRLAETALTQPALFTVEYALAHLWMSWGVEPEAMLGHSIGEYVAACLAGVMSVEEALILVAERGRLIQELPRGAMLSVPLPEEAARALAGDLAVAAVNAPDLTVLSGTAEAVDAVQAELAQRSIGGMECRRLRTSHAFHSAMMEPILDAFRERVGRVRLQPPSIPYLSNVTGTWIEAGEAVDPAYWTRHLRDTVRFAEGIEKLLREPDRLLLEVGPGSTLATLARRHPARTPRQVILSSLPHPRESASAGEVLLGAAGRIWLAGHPLDWQALHSERRPRRVPLPTYPFERQRFWIDASPEKVRRTGAREPVERWFSLPSWKRAAPVPQAEPDAPDNAGALWVVFGDAEGSGLSGLLARRLEGAGRIVAGVQPGSQLTRLGERSYACPPGDAASYGELLERLREHGRPVCFVHLWSVGAAASAEESRERGFFSLVYLARALAASPGDPVRLVVVASGVQDVTGDEELSPDRALLTGPCRVIPQELPHVTCRLIDVVAPLDRLIDRLVDRLVGELLSAAVEPVVAYRGNARWVPVFEPVLPASGGRGLPLREGGVYVVLGGLGRIGLAVAGYLAKTVRARLVLTRRSPLPPRADSDRWLGEQLRELEAAGAEVRTAALDIADEPALRALFADTEARWGRLHGVIHAAGVVGEEALQPIETIGEAEADLHFHAKVNGSLALERALEGRDLDFCLLFSSLSAILGGLGFAAYAAANAFEDALAQRRSRLGGPLWRSVSWDGWDFSAEGGTAAIRPAEADEALAGVFAIGGASRIAVSTTGLEERLARWSGPALVPAETSRAASAHPRPALSAAYAAPRTDLERRIAAIWQGLLGLTEVGIYDNFFELGGHSLLATQLAGKMRVELGTTVPLRAVFDAPTVAGLAGIAGVAPAEASRTPPMARAPRDGAQPLSFAQQRLWFLHQLDPESSSYNLHAPVQLGGELDIAALESSLNSVVGRHEVLRTAIGLTPDGPVQVIALEIRLILPLIDLGSLPAAAQQAERRRLSAGEARVAFDLARPPLLRACVLRLAPAEHVLLLTIHHIVWDAWSFVLFIQEVAVLYEAYRQGSKPQLPDLPVQYADFAAWQRSWLQGEALEAELDYWRRLLAGAPPLLPLPLDRPRPPVQTFRGARLPFALARTSAEDIRVLCLQHEVTLFMALLAAFQTLLHYYARCDHIVIGTDSAGRDRPEVEGLIGFFVNQLVLRTDLSGDPTFADLLQRVRGVTLGAYEHQDLPFDRLLAGLNPERSPGHAPLFQVKLVLQNIPGTVSGLRGLTLNVLAVEAETAQLDLILNLVEGPAGISGTFEYNTDLFNAATIERMARQLERLLGLATERPEIRLSELEAELAETDSQGARTTSLEGLRRARRREVSAQA